MGAETTQSGPATLDLKSNSVFQAIAVLGRLDKPTDGVRDYCSLLSQAFSRRGGCLAMAEVRWEDQGWLKALWKLWRESRAWTGRWVVFQYTGLMWSRRGFPFGAIAALYILRLHGAKLCVVFHDVSDESKSSLTQRVRIFVQYQTMRTAFRWATRPVLPVPLEQVPWVPRKCAEKGVFIPIGPNFSGSDRVVENNEDSPTGVPTIAIFGISGPPQTAGEIEEISYALDRTRSKISHLRIVVFGRGSAEAEAALRKKLDRSGVELRVLGLVPTKDLPETLSRASVLLCIRGSVSSRRGNAIAGIVCGLPLVGYRGKETGFPITEAGVLLFDREDRDGLADSLCRVLTDEKLRGELRRRSLAAAQEYFSWDSIAAQFVRALADQ